MKKAENVRRSNLTRQRETTGPEMVEAPTAGTVEASVSKILNTLIQGNFAMQYSEKTPIRQGFSLSDSVESLDLITVQLEDLRTLMSAIARLSADDNDIRGLAIHAKGIAGGLHNDADVLREQIQNHILAA
ncbi:hypothetical protein LQD23_16510 [Chromobacterium violaceum]|uniref:hypothetical protein n=1 Tax=Chromobacterium violaceum TaxID=536 RepID=UPI001E4C9C04|nr:hypothetical protein [Chromobacterium violaceum]MCD0493885.1 hypothetical protein [Chromobacterium violaceum]